MLSQMRKKRGVIAEGKRWWLLLAGRVAGWQRHVNREGRDTAGDNRSRLVFWVLLLVVAVFEVASTVLELLAVLAVW